jgi:plastocyanin
VTRLFVLTLACASLTTGPLRAQSLLDRSPNVSGDWIAPSGTVQFNFLHRFVRTDAPERKITSFPTFEIATGLPYHTQLGFLYATNSTLSPRYPNEWEFYGRWLPLSQERGAPVDLGGQLGYNLAARGLDGEVSVARAIGRVRLTGVTRLLDDPSENGQTDVALGGGVVVRLQRYIALAGDLVTLTNRDSLLGEKPAWSAGVHVAIPGTPHTLSIQATNTNTATLQGSSRGSSQRRYGFEFTIPFTLSRYFGRHQPPPVPPAAAPTAEAPTPDSSRVAAGTAMKASIKSLAFQPNRIEITAGTTVTWTNNDPLDHSVTAVDRSFDSGLIHSGRSWSHTFTTPGTYQFFCQPHPFMKGVVIVKERP